jgi:hypothetical protein
MKVKYVEKPDEGLVICIGEVGPHSLNEYIRLPYFISEEFRVLPTRYVGIAKCSEHDTFDVKVGRRVAYLKMMQKYSYTPINRLQKLLDALPALNLELGNSIDAIFTTNDVIGKSKAYIEICQISSADK